MAFAREDDGRISQRFFGAHTFRRTAFAGDYTGLEIQRTLVNRAAQLDVPILDTRLHHAASSCATTARCSAPTASTSTTAPATSSTPTP